ncbi:MAG: hypothetical protein AAB484_00685 [Patescibacteria group bacterium]
MKKFFGFVVIIVGVLSVRVIAQTPPAVSPVSVTSKKAVPTPSVEVIRKSSQPTSSLPSQIAALADEAELASYALRTAREVEISLYSSALIGNRPNKNIKLNGPVTLPMIQEAVTAANLSIRLSGLEEIWYHVNVHDTNWTVPLWGSQVKKPVIGKAGGYQADFAIELQLNSFVQILWSGVRQVKLTSFDNQGKIKDWWYLDVYNDGFSFPSDAAGKVLMEVTEVTPQGDKTTSYDLRKAAPVKEETMTTIVTVTARNIVSITDKSVLNLIPETRAGVGDNVLGEIILTKQTDVSIAAQTIEGGKATAFKYMEIGTDTTWRESVNASNGIIFLKLNPGKWHIVPIFPPEVLRSPDYQYYGGGGKG